MKTKQKDLTGLTIDTPGEIRASLKVLNDEVNSLQLMGIKLMKESRKKSKKIWEIIHKKMPELEGYDCSLKLDDMTIHVTTKQS